MAHPDGRHPWNPWYFGTREKDAARRDLTINALYWNYFKPDCTIRSTGEADLKTLINFTGDPAIRIKPDALHAAYRRFQATLDGQYHPDTPLHP